MAALLFTRPSRSFNALTVFFRSVSSVLISGEIFNFGNLWQFRRSWQYFPPDLPIRITRSVGLYSLFMLKEILEQGQRTIDASLEKLLPAASVRPESIHQAMRHSVFAGGKRLRPILCMEAARMIAGCVPEGVEELGSALEMLHTYSLIHDDLPALDNDDLRRGKPTCHVVFGEALAILAGDALQTQAYEVLARLKCPAEARVKIIEEIARGTGTVDGMIGGQVKDLEAERHKPDAATLEYI